MVMVVEVGRKCGGRAKSVMRLAARLDASLARVVK
jgi:hypothetical protein